MMGVQKGVEMAVGGLPVDDGFPQQGSFRRADVDQGHGIIRTAGNHEQIVLKCQGLVFKQI